MRWHWSVASLLAVCSCSFGDGSGVGDGADDPTTGANADDGGALTSPDPSAGPGGDDGGMAETAGMPSDTDDPSGGPPTSMGDGGDTSADGDTNDDTSGATTTGDPSLEPGCPEPLPAGWVTCVDFENTDGVPDGLSWITSDDNFVVSNDRSFSGDSAARIHHPQGDNNVGSAGINFGDSPHDNDFSNDQVFDEVWVRMWFASDTDWPGDGHGELLQLNALDDDELRISQAVLRAEPNADVYQARATTCVFDGVQNCDGNQDWLDDYDYPYQTGSQAVLPPGDDGWHCAVVHAKLNDPGHANAEIDFEIDGVYEAGMADFDWRADWTTGFNAALIPSWATGSGLDDAGTRYVDDFVIASTPLTCPGR